MTIGPPETLETPTLVGRWSELRPVTEDYYEFLFALSTCQEIGYRCRFRGEIPSPEMFVRSLWHGVPAQFVVTRQNDRRGFGHVFAHDVNLRDGHARITAIFSQEAQRCAWPMEACGLFIDYLSRIWDLRKIYSEIADFNLEPIRSVTRPGLFKSEGVLREHVYYAGHHWDMQLLALYQEDWQRVRSRFLAGALRNRGNHD
jgi:hypothetical protein